MTNKGLMGNGLIEGDEKAHPFSKYKEEIAKKMKGKKKSKIDKFGGGTGGGFREGQCVNCGKHTKGGKCPRCDK